MSNNFSWELDEHGGYTRRKASKFQQFPFQTVIISAVVCVVLLICYSAFHRHSAPQRPIFTPNTNVSADTAGFLGLGEKVDASIVSIESPIPDIGGFFSQMIPTSSQSASGVIISSDGYILTSLSALSADTVDVCLSDGNTYTATLKESDQMTDTAILKIDADSLTPLAFGDSDSLLSGQTVGVCGRFLSGKLSATLNLGTICGVDKGIKLQNEKMINLIQTDAPVAKVCNGAVLLNANGAIVGMTTAMVSSGSDEISLAIPSNDIYAFVSSVLDVASEAPASSGASIGIRGSDAEYGINVESVLKDSPADKAGIKENDLIMKVDGTVVKSIAEINTIRDAHKPGDKLIFTVYRDGETLDIEVEI